LASKIGVISPKLPHQDGLSFHAPLDSHILWFNEIEAGFAYLLHDILDKLIIDRVFIDSSHAYTRKYQKLIEQIHPYLEMSFLDFDRESFSVEGLANLKYFPKLDTLFKNGDLKSLFQPIIELRGESHVIHGIECLSRFNFNGQFFAPEYIFNYAAEKLRLTNYDKICLMQALSIVPHDKNTLIFINVRPQTLIANDFNPWFKTVLKKNQLLPEQIVIEVTEQYCNISERAMIERCEYLRSQGLRLAIDDFGAGISNLSMLEIMKPSYIKISGRFIKNSHLDERKKKIIKNILDLANDFGIVPIVESVELVEEWHQVTKMGARLAQGFYFFRPMDQANLEALLKNQSVSSILVDS
jgi:EAL domain-containing protein (putative c-di-GMP-specific phosphodiesterase class I)